jgi:acyl dehydratase
MRYWEDFAAGQVYELGSITVDEDEMLAFAARYDPQPFHLDHDAAASGPFGALAASGLLTYGLFLRLYVLGLLNSSASMGAAGIGEVRFLAPVFAGDVLSAKVTVHDTAPSSTNPVRGTVLMTGEVMRNGSTVVTIGLRNMFGRRSPSL